MTIQKDARSIYERVEDISRIVGSILELADDLDTELLEAKSRIEELEEELEKTTQELETKISNLNEENGGKDDEISRLNRIILELEERIEDLE